MNEITCVVRFIYLTISILKLLEIHSKVAEAPNRWAPFIQTVGSVGRSSTKSVLVGAVGSPHKRPHNATVTVRVELASLYCPNSPQ